MLNTGTRRMLGLAIGGVLAVVLSGTAAGAATHPRTTKAVSVVQSTKAGSILVAGTAVYTLTPSARGCTATCRHEWPPVLLAHGATHADAGPGVDPSQLGTAKAGNGARQVTYAGKRLYWSAKDKTATQVHGNVTNKWGHWSTVAVASTPTTTAPAPTTAAPATEAPTAPAATAPPATAAPQTAPPQTEPPTQAPQTAPPTQPPTTQPKGNPGNGGVGF